MIPFTKWISITGAVAISRRWRNYFVVSSATDRLQTNRDCPGTEKLWGCNGCTHDDTYMHDMWQDSVIIDKLCILKQQFCRGVVPISHGTSYHKISRNIGKREIGNWRFTMALKFGITAMLNHYILERHDQLTTKVLKSRDLSIRHLARYWISSLSYKHVFNNQLSVFNLGDIML